ncbi:MAG: hypothetical protein PWQ79_1924 [Thermococcaceae archaeon]|nr:hypothetical protein [Thermococcaceae archaeon]MDK2915009.1 hypothetical protein [Thermococcaceae archaeon]
MARVTQMENSPLKKYGYKVGVIEFQTEKTDHEKTNPDLILTTEEQSHSLLVECKAEALKSRQLRKYEELSPEVLLSYFTVKNPEIYYIDPVIFSLSNKTCEKRPIKDHPLPVIVLKYPNGNKICLECNDFRRGHMYGTLHKIFTECIEVSDKILRLQIPDIYLDPNEDCRAFVKRLLESITSYILKEQSKEIYPERLAQYIYHMWEVIGPQKQNQIINNVTLVLKRISAYEKGKTRGKRKPFCEFKDGKLIISSDTTTHEAMRRFGNLMVEGLDVLLKKTCDKKEKILTLDEALKRKNNGEKR